MNRTEASQLGDQIPSDLRKLGAFYGHRIEVSSDMDGALGRFCCAVSDGDRKKQGFGSSIEEAISNFHNQPVRASTNMK